MSKIRIVNGPYRGREKTLGDKALTIGRDAEAGVQILDRSASRFHAEVFPVGGMWFVRDLDSKNGTFVNDEKVGDEELLREGDVIKIGSTELVFESGAALTDDESSNRISYRDDPDVLSKTLEFRLDELSDIAEPAKDDGVDSARSLRILYQIGRMLSDSAGHAPNDREAKVLDYLVRAMPAESALIFRREGATGRLIPTTVRTAAPGIQPVISRSIVKKTFSENKALHIANAQDDERFDRSASVAQKGVRSVLCVPLAIAGQVRGVVYLGRGENAPPFEPLDLELASAVAIQLGLWHHALDQQKKHKIALAKVMGAMVLALEAREGFAGAGERTARFCLALSGAMGLDAQAKDRLARAGLIFPAFAAGIAANGKDGPALDALLEKIEDFETVVPLLRGARQLDEDSDTEAQILAAAAGFERRIAAEPAADIPAVIEELRRSRALDPEVAAVLHGCHLDGSLYNTRLE
jgi:hypothetical protein